MAISKFYRFSEKANDRFKSNTFYDSTSCYCPPYHDSFNNFYKKLDNNMKNIEESSNLITYNKTLIYDLLFNKAKRVNTININKLLS